MLLFDCRSRKLVRGENVGSSCCKPEQEMSDKYRGNKRVCKEGEREVFTYSGTQYSDREEGK